jgi:hypothetical protein
VKAVVKIIATEGVEVRLSSLLRPEASGLTEGTEGTEIPGTEMGAALVKVLQKAVRRTVNVVKERIL